MTPQESQYYSRQILLDNFGIQNQEKLNSASILVIGAGGLGCPVLQSLAGMGIGNIGIVDYDKVSLSNLHRQTIYKHENIGEWKCEMALQYLKSLNPFITIDTFRAIADQETLPALVENFDIVVDCTDNPISKYLINDVCVKFNKPLVYGSVFKMEGNVSVFNLNEDSPTLRCLFPENNIEMPDCNRTGILGIITATTGLYMATEVVKIIVENDNVLSGKLLIIKPLENSTEVFSFKTSQNGRAESLKNFQNSNSSLVISPKALQHLMESEAAFDLIDVRTEEEHDLVNIGGKLIPIDELEDRVNEIDHIKKTVVYCHHGIRSQNAADFLRKSGFSNILNMEGGIHAWSMEIDENVRIY
ncbi:MAG: ThiF family adenylyltransferase [Cytophagales bacterium]